MAEEHTFLCWDTLDYHLDVIGHEVLLGVHTAIVMW